MTKLRVGDFRVLYTVGGLVAIKSIEPVDSVDSDDSLVNDVLNSNASFRAFVEKSKAGPRREFTGRQRG
jgi:hypothetical protein